MPQVAELSGGEGRPSERGWSVGAFAGRGDGGGDPVQRLDSVVVPDLAASLNNLSGLLIAFSTSHSGAACVAACATRGHERVTTVGYVWGRECGGGPVEGDHE